VAGASSAATASGFVCGSVAQDTGAVVTAGRGFVSAGQRRLMVAAGQVGQGQVVMDQAQSPRVAGRADGCRKSAIASSGNRTYSARDGESDMGEGMVHSRG
jgi:hypothetical protein